MLDIYSLPFLIPEKSAMSLKCKPLMVSPLVSVILSPSRPAESTEKGRKSTLDAAVDGLGGDL